MAKKKVKLENGKVYDLHHARKGKFKAKVIEQTNEFVTLEVVDGCASFVSVINQLRGRRGDVFDVRKDFIISASFPANEPKEDNSKEEKVGCPNCKQGTMEDHGEAGTFCNLCNWEKGMAFFDPSKSKEDRGGK